MIQKSKKDFKVNILAENAPISREQGTFPTLPYYGWPSVAVDENDVVYAVVSKRLLHVDPYGKVMLYKSTDKGQTWDAGTCIYNSALDDRDAGIAYMGNGKILVTTFSHNAKNYVKNDVDKWVKWQRLVGPENTEAVFDRWKKMPEADLLGCSSYLISTDYGKTWSEPRKMPITAPHGPSFTKDGKLIYIGVPKAPELAGEDLPDGVYCYFSMDRGETWERKSELPVDLSCTPVECYGIELRDGTILAAIRANETLHTLICRSEDGGETWSEPEDVCYGIPPHLLELPDGTVVLSTATRAKADKAEYVRFSPDGGKTWSDGVALTKVSDPEHYIGADIGYPATARFSDGTLITVYYQVLDGDTTPSFCRTVWEIG